MKFWSLAIVIGVLLLSVEARATTQASDPLIWKGKTVYPSNGPNLRGAFAEGKYPDFDVRSTANYKGYSGKWAFNAKTLYLTSLSGFIDKKKVGLGDVFPGAKSPLAATWFSGVIIISEGKRIGLGRELKRMVYTKEKHLTIKKGKLVKVEEKKFDPQTTPVWPG